MANGVVRLACCPELAFLLPICLSIYLRTEANFEGRWPRSHQTDAIIAGLVGCCCTCAGNCTSSNTRTAASISQAREDQAKERQDGGKARRAGRAGEWQTRVGGDEKFSFPFPFLLHSPASFFPFFLFLWFVRESSKGWPAPQFGRGASGSERKREREREGARGEREGGKKERERERGGGRKSEREREGGSTAAVGPPGARRYLQRRTQVQLRTHNPLSFLFFFLAIHLVSRCLRLCYVCT